MKSNDMKGRCLHFDRDERCKSFVAAHSIQKSGQLKGISEGGHVYQINAEIGYLRKNEGRLKVSKVGIEKISTFLGFCKEHDNSLFKPIDTGDLIPTPQQIALYAYRCLCREYFVKENAVSLAQSSVAKEGVDKWAGDLIRASLCGHEFALENLKCHKLNFDRSIEAGSFEDFSFVMFICRQQQPVAVSGLIYPDFDFEGNQLQDLGGYSLLDLVTFFTAPVEVGWAFVFCWHKSSDFASRNLIGSLQECVGRGEDLMSIILSFIFSASENHALRCSWWDSLDKTVRDEIVGSMSFDASLINEIDSRRFVRRHACSDGLAFDAVVTNLDVSD